MKKRKSRRDDPGGEAMEMVLIKRQQAAEAKKRNALEKAGAAPVVPDASDSDDPWGEDF